MQAIAELQNLYWSQYIQLRRLTRLEERLERLQKAHKNTPVGNTGDASMTEVD